MITLVCRDSTGAEIMRQTVGTEAEANRLMIARNRPLRDERSFYRWGIESEIPVDYAHAKRQEIIKETTTP